MRKREAIYFHQEGVALESVGGGGKGCCLVCGAGAASHAAIARMGVVWWVSHALKIIPTVGVGIIFRPEIAGGVSRRRMGH